MFQLIFWFLEALSTRSNSSRCLTNSLHIPKSMPKKVGYCLFWWWLYTCQLECRLILGNTTFFFCIYTCVTIWFNHWIESTVYPDLSSMYSARSILIKHSRGFISSFRTSCPSHFCIKFFPLPSQVKSSVLPILLWEDSFQKGLFTFLHSNHCFGVCVNSFPETTLPKFGDVISWWFVFCCQCFLIERPPGGRSSPPNRSFLSWFFPVSIWDTLIESQWWLLVAWVEKWQRLQKDDLCIK